ncbi:MAG TPA: hypothetical protein VGG84_02405 [Gemmatimonadaceae bacterium]|jgi:hypothetical protein
MLRARIWGSTAVLATAILTAPLGAQSATDSVGPSTIRYKGVQITPIAFFAAEALYRQRNETADMGSSFNGIPFSQTTNGQMSEFRASGRQSRFGLLAEGKLPTMSLTGYWEGDFLSAGVTSNSNESNSYTFRVRQFWGQAAFPSGFTVSGGQMWSLLTPSKSGVLPRGEFTPLTIDAQYAVGYDWARQAGFRISQKLSNGLWLALAAEEPQMTFAARNAPTNFVIGQAGGSQLNSGANYSTDMAPDVVAKVALEPGFGHWEVKAVGRAFRERIVDPTNVNGGSRNDNTFAGGIGASAFLPFAKMADLTISGLYGRGIGRYGTSQLPDVTVHADGSLAPIRQAHGMVELDVHATPKFDVYAIGGVEYAFREASVSAAGRGVGYGSPILSNAGCDAEYAPTGPFAPGGTPAGTCNADTRSLAQGNLGFWYRFYRGPAGTFQWGMHASHTVRNTWDGLGDHPQANENMLFTSFRYYVP